MRAPRRPRVSVPCAKCARPYLIKASELARRQAKGHNTYCSRLCADLASERGASVECHICKRIVYRQRSYLDRSKTKTYFCGAMCRSAWVEKVMPSGEHHVGWKEGAGSYRQRALKHYGKICTGKQCPMTTIPDHMFDVDHIDGNRSNNELSNLQVLCVWCHALKTRASWGLGKKSRKHKSKFKGQSVTGC